MKADRLLREYVREILSEDDGYGDLYAVDAGMNPYGVSFGSGEELYNIFVKPFTDVVKTAAGKTKELSQKAQTVVKVAFEAAATSLIPVLRDSYSEIFAKEKEEIEQIRKEYSDIYQSNWDAFQDNDVMVAAFMYAPAFVITAKLANKSPKATLNLISVLSGGSLDPWISRVKDKYGMDVKSKANAPAHGQASDIPMEGVIREDADQLPPIGDVLANKKVLARLDSSPKVKEMEQRGRSMVRNTLQKVVKQATGVLKAQSLQDLQAKTGTKLKGMDKLAQIPEQERRSAEQELLAGAKKGMKAFYVKSLEGQVKKALEAGVPENHPFVQDYRKVIARVQSL